MRQRKHDSVLGLGLGTPYIVPEHLPLVSRTNYWRWGTTSLAAHGLSQYCYKRGDLGVRPTLLQRIYIK